MTLPTRPDGGIDWENWLSKSMYGYSLSEVKQAATHARERCVKWHDEQVMLLEKAIINAEKNPTISPKEFMDAEAYLRTCISEHKRSAAAIRKMED